MRRTRTTALALLAAVLLAGCSDDDDAGPATTTTEAADATASTTTSVDDCPASDAVETGVLARTLTVDGTERTYLVDVPADYDGEAPVPVVFTFHGMGSNSPQQLAYSGWGRLGEEEGFLTVAPDAQPPDPRAWDFLSPASRPGSDAAFIAALLDELERTFCVDPTQVFASGMSSGSAFSFGLACRGEIPFAAFGSVAATFYAEALCGEAPPASIMYFHGTGDAVVPYDGGPVSVSPGTEVAPAATTMTAWAQHNGCGEPETSKPADDVERTLWAGCAEDGDLDFYTVVGGGHSWPGAIAIDRLGPTTGSIDATALMWAFFEAHPLTR